MTYVDGFLVSVPNAKKDAYREHAEKAGAIFKEFGMLSMVECWGDDVPEGKLTSMPLAVQRKDDETVVFSWVPRVKSQCDEKFVPTTPPRVSPFPRKAFCHGH